MYKDILLVPRVVFIYKFHCISYMGLTVELVPVDLPSLEVGQVVVAGHMVGILRRDDIAEALGRDPWELQRQTRILGNIQ